MIILCDTEPLLCRYNPGHGRYWPNSNLRQCYEDLLLPPFPVEVPDTTAAGDSFVAALAVGLAEGKSLQKACNLANAVGALTVTKMGAQPSLPTRTEVNKFLENQEMQ